MSRTIRRKDYVPAWVKTDWVRVPGTYQYRKIPLEGKDLAKSLHRHHGDAGCVTRTASGIGCPKWFRQMCQRIHRAECQQEMRKYLKNYEYECMIVNNPKLPYWD
jgi:hypothetical protein